MTDQERIERLEFLLKSTEDMVIEHMAARDRAVEAISGLSREGNYRELRGRVEQLETQLRYCLKAAEDGVQGHDGFPGLEDYHYIYSPALKQTLNLHKMFEDVILDRDDKQKQLDDALLTVACLKETTEALAQQVIQLESGSRLDDLKQELDAQCEFMQTPEAKKAARDLLSQEWPAPMNSQLEQALDDYLASDAGKKDAEEARAKAEAESKRLKEAGKICGYDCDCDWNADF
jgi:hypothetical protein